MKLEEFEKTIKTQTRPIVVEMWATWCGPCKMTRPILQSLSHEFKEKVQFLEVDADQSPEVMQNLRVMAVPTMVIFQDGRETYRQVGAQSPAAYRNLFEQLAGGVTLILPPSTLDRVLRLTAGTVAIYFGLSGTINWLFLSIGAIAIFSAFYDRCPMWRALTNLLKKARQ
jgi:thioredoxin 1